MDILDPMSEGNESEKQPLAPRIDDVEGARIGLLSNGKQAAEPVLNVVEEMLEEAHDDFEIDYYLVEELNMLKDPAELDRIGEWAEDVDCVISAIGDCGSCTKFLAWAADSVEEAGTPAVGLLDEGFVLDWKSNAIEKGRALRYTVIPVRCEVTDRDRIRNDMTFEVLDEIEDELTRPLDPNERVEKTLAD